MWRGWFGRPVLSATEARQGYRDRPVLVVLIVSTVLALALVLLALVWPVLA